MEELHAPARGDDLGDRIPAGEGGPVDVDLELEFARQPGQEGVPQRRTVEAIEFEGVVVVTEPEVLRRERLTVAGELFRQPTRPVERCPVPIREPGHDDTWAAQRGHSPRDRVDIGAQVVERDVRGDRAQAVLAEEGRDSIRRQLG